MNDELKNRTTHKVKYGITDHNGERWTTLNCVDIKGLDIPYEEIPEDNKKYFTEHWAFAIRTQTIAVAEEEFEQEHFDFLMSECKYFTMGMLLDVMDFIVAGIQESVSLGHFETIDFISISTKVTSLLKMITITKYGFSSPEEYESHRTLNGFFTMYRNVSIPLSEKNSSRYVYLIHTDHGVKIGKSVNVKTRIKTVSSNLPFKVIHTEFFKVENHHKTEIHFHKKYESKRINGEWFDLSKRDIEDIRLEIKNHE